MKHFLRVMWHLHWAIHHRARRQLFRRWSNRHEAFAWNHEDMLKTEVGRSPWRDAALAVLQEKAK